MNDRTVRVCHIITRLELGGAQDNTLYTVGHLRAPYRASLICGEGGILDDEVRADDRLPVSFVPTLARPIRPLRDLRALLDLTGRLRRERPHVVHTHSSKAGILGRLAARLAGVPVIVHTIHGFGFHGGQPRPLRWALIAMERAVAPLTSHFIAVSRANLDQGIALGIIPPARASLIRSGIRLEEFRAASRGGKGGSTPSGPADSLRKEIGVGENTPLVGMVACLKPQKCPLDFVEVAARVAAAVPRAVFVMAGDGELRGEVERRAESLGLSGRLRLLGWRRDVPRVMAALDVMLLTSRWEGLPRVLPEAIAAGVPIVATAVDGTNDIIRDGGTGFVCRPHDVNRMARAVERLLRDRSLSLLMCRRARDVLEEFDIDRMVRAQEELYARLTDGVPAPEENAVPAENGGEVSSGHVQI